MGYQGTSPRCPLRGGTRMAAVATASSDTTTALVSLAPAAATTQDTDPVHYISELGTVFYSLF